MARSAGAPRILRGPRPAPSVGYGSPPAGTLSARNAKYDRSRYTATVDGRIAGVGNTIRITAIHVHSDLAIPAGARDAAERALAVHEQGCPEHQSVKHAITITWDATIEEY